MGVWRGMVLFVPRGIGDCEGDPALSAAAGVDVVNHDSGAREFLRDRSSGVVGVVDAATFYQNHLWSPRPRGTVSEIGVLMG